MRLALPTLILSIFHACSSASAHLDLDPPSETNDDLLPISLMHADQFGFDDTVITQEDDNTDDNESRYLKATREISIPLGPNFGPGDSVEICFKGARRRKWKIAIVDGDQSLNSKNVGDKWLHVCGSQSCNKAKKNGCVTFQKSLFDNLPGKYNAFLTTNALKKRAGPAPFTIFGAETAPPSASPTDTPCDPMEEIKRIQEGDDDNKRANILNSFRDSPDAFDFSSSVESSPLFDDYGCFYHDSDEDKAFTSEPLSSVGSSRESMAQECDSICDTKHFAITDTTCFCYIKAPKLRLAIGSCDSGVPTSCIKKSDMMDAFLKDRATDECNQETTSAVRNFFVEEDDAPFGYDIMTNAFRLSPFELYKDECGTNIYEIQTEVSEGTNTLTTVSKEVTEFAEERRSHVSTSISRSASASLDIPFIIDAGAEVSASLDTEVNELLKFSGSSTIGSKVFTSFGVKRLAEVKLVDFVNKFNFITFNDQFANLLRRYRDSDFNLAVAKEIFDKYGMFVMERGLFGGYRQLRSTATSEDIEQFSSSENDFRLCFEAAMSVNAKALFGLIQGEASGDNQLCTEEAKKRMNRLQQQFSQEVTNEVVQGGRVIDLPLGGRKSFVVSPQDSILLTDRDLYPEGDDGIELRLITDLLIPDKISPLEVKRHLITERHFEEIQSHLEAHILEVLSDQVEILDECPKSSECTVPYLEETIVGGEALQCACYTPTPPEPTDICGDGIFQPKENQFYTIGKGGSFWKAESNIILSAKNAQSEAKAHWTFQPSGNNWILKNGQNGSFISGIGGDGHIVTSSSTSKALIATCQADGTVKFSDSDVGISRFGSTVQKFSKSTSCRFEGLLDSCKKTFGSLFKTEEAMKKCGVTDSKRFRVCTQTSITLPKREVLRRTTKCDFPNFLEDCDDAFGPGWKQIRRTSCGAIKKRRECEFRTTDRSSSFDIAPVPQ